MAHSHIVNLLLLLAIVLLPSCWANDCRIPSILVDIHNRQVHGRADIFRYGLSIGLGNPSQNDSLWPAITHNKTFFAADDYCGSNGPAGCLDGTRGFFSAENSASWRNVSASTPVDTNLMFGNATELNGEDTLNLWQTKTYGGPQTLVALDDFPATILSDYIPRLSLPTFYGPGGTLGLGSDSTVLSKMFQAGLIAARSFGLYLGPGFDGLGDQTSGSLVLGGYDAARFDGSLAIYDQVQALSDNVLSPFKVTVNQVSLITSGGETILNFVEKAFDAYISTDRRPVQFPTAVTEKLVTALRATPSNNQDRTLKLPANFKGNLTITLSNNLTLVYDSSWMTDSLLNTPISATPLQNGSFAHIANGDEDVVVFGAAFLARAYLFVNYDSSPPNFGLAQALPGPNQIQLSSYCANQTPIAASSIRGQHSKDSRKALIGGLCGGLLGTLAVLLGIWIFCGGRIRKHLRRNDPRHQSSPDSYLSRPTIKMTLHNLKSTIWSGNTKGAGYAYRDVESAQMGGRHNSAFGLSYNHEKNRLVRPISQPGNAIHRSLNPEDALTIPLQQENTNDMASYDDDDDDARRSISPPRGIPAYSSDQQALLDFSNGSHLSMSNNTKSPNLISAYNTHARNDSIGLHSRNGSATNRDLLDIMAIGSTNGPTVSIDANVERQAYDKSLPATPAQSVYAKSSVRLSQSSVVMGNETNAHGSTTHLRRLPSFAFTPTNLTFQTPTVSAPPIPAIPESFVPSIHVAAPREGNRHEPKLSPTTSHDSSSTLATVEQPTPISASTTYTYSFWRDAISRKFTADKLSHAPAEEIILYSALDSSIHPITQLLRPNRTNKSQKSPHSYSLKRTQTTSTSASSKKSRHATATAVSRLRRPNVREIIISKTFKSKSTAHKSTMVDIHMSSPLISFPMPAPLPVSDQPDSTLTVPSSTSRPAPAPAPAPTPIPQPASQPRQSATTHPRQIVGVGTTIKRKAIALPTYRAGTAGISPCVSACDDLLDISELDRSISPISSLSRATSRGRRYHGGAITPPLPPFPMDLADRADRA